MLYLVLLVILNLALFFLSNGKYKQGKSLLWFYFLFWALFSFAFLLGFMFERIRVIYELLEFEALSLGSFLYIAVAQIIFFVSYQFGNLIVVSKERLLYSYKPNLTYFFLACCSLIFFLVDVVINFQVYAHPLESYVLNRSHEQDASIFSKLAVYTGIVCLPVSLTMLLRKQFTVINFVPVTVIFLISVFNLSKFIFLFILFFCFVNLVVDPQTSRLYRFSLKKIGLTALVIFTFFIAITKTRSNDSPVEIDTLAITYTYFSGYLPSFSNYFDELTRYGYNITEPSYEQFDFAKNRFGNQTFAGFYRLLYEMKVVKYSATVHYSGKFNVYTYFRDLITDFGIFGSLLFLLVWGILFGLANRNLNRYRFTGSLYTTLLGVFLLFTVTYSFFGFIFSFLLFIVTPFLIQNTKVECIS